MGKWRGALCCYGEEGAWWDGWVEEGYGVMGDLCYYAAFLTCRSLWRNLPAPGTVRETLSEGELLEGARKEEIFCGLWIWCMMVCINGKCQSWQPRLPQDWPNQSSHSDESYCIYSFWILWRRIGHYIIESVKSEMLIWNTRHKMFSACS